MIKDAGIDTWSPCWYVTDDGPACRAMQALATRPAKRGMLVDEEVDGHRVGWFPDSRLVYAEGHPEPGGLAKSHDLPAALSRLEEAMEDRGIELRRERATRPMPRAVGGTHRHSDLNGFAGLRRLDATVDLSFDDPHLGLAVLTGVASLTLPRIKTEVIREVGGPRVETVYMLGSSGKRVLGRWYDKGQESGEAPRGMLIRPEDQRRFGKDTRPTVEAIADSSYVRDQFTRRFEPLWLAAKGVKVAGAIDLTLKVAELEEEGKITSGQAKSVIGALMLEAAQANRQSKSQRYRDRALARKLGLVLSETSPFGEVDVDIGQVIEQALESECWGQG